MKAFDRLEKKYRHLAVPRLMYYITILYALGLLIWLYDPMIYFEYFCLNVSAVLSGQVWRLVSFLVFPPAFGTWTFSQVLFGIVALMLYNNLGQTLEQIWGAFRFNIFFLLGVLAQILAAFFGYFVFGQTWIMTTGYINAAIFMAFALSYPDTQFLLFFVLPIRARWLAAAECVIYLYNFINGSASTRVGILFSLIAVLFFFVITRDDGRPTPAQARQQAKRRADFKREVKKMEAKSAVGAPRHRCAVCGRTELDDGDLEFRYCSRCEGAYEYCQDHLYTHTHVTKQEE